MPAFVSLTRELHASVDANTKRTAELKTFQPPVGLIWGAGDPYLNKGVAEHLHGLFSSSKLTLLSAGHWPQIDAPEQVAQALFALPIGS